MKINESSTPFKNVREEQWNKPKGYRGKESIKIKTEINELGNRKRVELINPGLKQSIQHINQ